MKKIVFSLFASSMILLTACGANDTASTNSEENSSDAETTENSTEANTQSDIEIANDLFSITIPAEYEDIYDSEVSEDKIIIYRFI